MGQLGSVKGQEPANKGRKFPPEVLTTDEVAAIIAGCSAKSLIGIRNRALLTLLYRSGLRVSEVLALRPSDVNLAAHSVRVLHGKGDKATTRGFHPTATDALARWMDKRSRAGRYLDYGRPLRGPLFCTLRGDPLASQYVRNMMHRLAASAGIEKRAHPHGLRHTFAWELEQAGVPVTVISALLGHSSVAVTARYLNHLTNHQAITALEAVDLPALEAAK